MCCMHGASGSWILYLHCYQQIRKLPAQAQNFHISATLVLNPEIFALLVAAHGRLGAVQFVAKVLATGKVHKQAEMNCTSTFIGNTLEGFSFKLIPP